MTEEPYGVHTVCVGSIASAESQLTRFELSTNSKFFLQRQDAAFGCFGLYFSILEIHMCGKCDYNYFISSLRGTVFFTSYSACNTGGIYF